jgi:RND family efflux transporter MFP subunit
VSDPTPAEASAAARPGGTFAFLDHALWRQFLGADNPADMARAWLALQCRFIDGATGGVVVVGEPDVGPFAPLAYWPGEETHDPALAEAAERAMAERKAVVQSDADPSASTTSEACFAHPFFVEDHLCGVVAVNVTGSPAEMRRVIRQLQWGSGWLEAMWRRQQDAEDYAYRERTRMAFDMVAAVLEQRRFTDACHALVTELAVRLDCDEVSVGFLKRGHTDVVAVSHASKFGSRMNLIREIGAAMDEAIDQRAIVLYPAEEDWEYRVTRDHAELAAANSLGAALTIPLHVGDEMAGALTFERGREHRFDDAAIEMCDAIASVVGPILDEKRLNDRNIFIKLGESVSTQLHRLVGPNYFGRKLVAGTLVLLVLLFSTVSGDYRVTSPAVLEGLVQRSVVAPFEGYLASQRVRAGETVEEGDVLATLDDRDLSLERLRWFTTHRQRLAEYDRALAEGDRAEANIIRAQIDQAKARIQLLDEQLARTRIVAPFTGIIVAGDLSQAVGATVERGQELFKITPLDAYRVILEVDESDIEGMQVGQAGTLRIASIPEQPLEYTVERITPISEQGDGRNFYRVEARLDAPIDAIRPGMKGIAKTYVEERLLIRIWTEKFTDWVRLKIWKWLP